MPMPPRSSVQLLSRILGIFGLCLLATACATARPPADNARINATIGLDSQLRLAGAALAGGDIDSALRLYRAAVRDFPDANAAQQRLADAYYAIKAYPEARAAYQRLGTLDGGSPAHLLGLGRVGLALGDTDAAGQAFAAALTLAPDHPQALNGQAVALDLAGQHGDAQAIYRHLLQRDPTNRAVVNNLALSLALAGDSRAAIDSLTTLADGPAIIPEARHNLALAYALAGNQVAAQDLIRRDLPRQAVDETVAFYGGLSPVVAPAGR